MEKKGWIQCAVIINYNNSGNYIEVGTKVIKTGKNLFYNFCSIINAAYRSVLFNCNLLETAKKEEMNYEQLAKTLGITVQDLELLDFFNQEIFDSSGVAVQNEIVFSNISPREILAKIKGLNENKHIILDV